MDPKPLWLLAELTYKCPLQCPYCSNPLDFAGPRFKRELSTDEWRRVFREAKALGVLQLGLSGGEPTLRADLEALVGEARGLGLYTSLITSAYRLTKERLAALKAAGLDHVQISIRSEEHTSELQSLAYLVCRLLLEKKKKNKETDVDNIKIENIITDSNNSEITKAQYEMSRK